MMKNIVKGPGKGIISHDIKNYDNDPVVVKKVEKARETILRVGFPKIDQK